MQTRSALDHERGQIAGDSLGTPFPAAGDATPSRGYGRPSAEASAARRPGRRTQPMRGFDDAYVDIVDYIVRITDKIWVDRAIGLVYDTYDHACVVYSMYGVVRSVEEVIASTVIGINVGAGRRDSSPQRRLVRRRGPRASTHRTWGSAVPPMLARAHTAPRRASRVEIALRRRLRVPRDNRIHTEWLVRDNGAFVEATGVRQRTTRPAPWRRPVPRSEIPPSFRSLDRLDRTGASPQPLGLTASTPSTAGYGP